MPIGEVLLFFTEKGEGLNLLKFFLRKGNSWFFVSCIKVYITYVMGHYNI